MRPRSSARFGGGEEEELALVEVEVHLFAVGGDRELAGLAAQAEQVDEVGHADVTQFPYERHDA